MKRKIGKFAVVAALMAGSFGLGVGVSPVTVKAETSGFATFLQVYDLLKTEYVESGLQDDKLVYGAIRGMLATLDDPYTRFMDPKAFQGMQEERQGSFSGVGIQLGMNKAKQLSVVAPIEGTPAFKAGLKAEDAILAIDGKSTKDMAIEEAVSLIRGPKGTKVVLKVQAKGAKVTKDVALVRDNIATKAVTVKDEGSDLGYIRLSTFMANDADDEIASALAKFKDKKGLILDLRGNPGGLLPNAVDIGSMFIQEGPIVQIVDRDGQKQVLRASGKTLVPTTLPMVVLVDGGSASASEILSGALQDDKRAILIGTKTFGKGLVQTVHPLADGSGVAITTNKYLTAGGHDIHKKGITPDIVVDLPKIELDAQGNPKNPDALKNLKDTQLERAKVYLRGLLAKAK